MDSGKTQETNSFLLENGELSTNSTSLTKPIKTTNVMSNEVVSPCVIVYYENYFRDGWVGVGNDPIARYVLQKNDGLKIIFSKMIIN